MKILKVIDKLFCAAVFAPPLYFVFRFLRWYIKQETSQTEEVKTESQ